MSERRVTTGDGVELWVRSVGNQTAPTVLCCHGGPGIADYLEPVEEVLIPEFRVVRWDQRGSGRSDPVGPFTINRFVRDIEDIREALGLERYVMLGHSWGANLAILHAQVHPLRLDGIVYVAGTGLEWWPRFSSMHKDRQAGRLGPRHGALLEELRTKARTEAEDREFRTLYIQSELHDVHDRPTAERLLAGEDHYPRSEAANSSLNAECKALPLDRQVDACRSITCPVLVVHGASDPRPFAALDSLVGALPRVEAKVVGRAGHRPWVEDRTGFGSVMRTFISDALAGR